MRTRYFDNEQIRRLESILDTTFADLKIDPLSPFAKGAREFVARLLFETELDLHPDYIATQALAARVRSYGPGRRGQGGTQPVPMSRLMLVTPKPKLHSSGGTP